MISICGDHGENESPLTFVVGDLLLIAEGHLDLFPGRDVGDGECEEVWAILLQQGRASTLAESCLIGASGLLLLFDDGVDDSVADFERHPMHRRFVGQGKEIDGLDRLASVVGEELLDLDFGHGAIDFGRDVGVL